MSAKSSIRVQEEKEGASYGNQFVRIKQWVATLNVAWAETWKPSGYGNIKWGCLNKTDILISEWPLSEFWVVSVSLLFCTHHQVVRQTRGGGLQWSVVTRSSWCHLTWSVASLMCTLRLAPGYTRPPPLSIVMVILSSDWSLHHSQAFSLASSQGLNIFISSLKENLWKGEIFSSTLFI